MFWGIVQHSFNPFCELCGLLLLTCMFLYFCLVNILFVVVCIMSLIIRSKLCGSVVHCVTDQHQAVIWLF